METMERSPEDLVALLNQAVARELQVSIQYMFQHSRGTQGSADLERGSSTKQVKFVASHAPYFFPGATLKKVAIGEMRHAEAIAERVVALGGEPTTSPAPVTVADRARTMIADDREMERQAIELYVKIVGLAEELGDETTAKLFRRILGDEEKHHKIFSDLLKDG